MVIVLFVNTEIGIQKRNLKMVVELARYFVTNSIYVLLYK